MKSERRHVGHTAEALAIFRRSIHLEGEGASLCEEVSSMRFMSSAVIWLDIIGSITEGTEPRLLPMHDMELGTGTGILLEEVMGCQNKVIVQIGRIAALHARRSTAVRTGCLLEPELLIQEIGNIRENLYQADQEVITLMREVHEPRQKESETIAKVTRFFSDAAKIYLHLITTGFQASDALQQLTAEAMTYLLAHITSELINGLVCPLFIVGCAVDRQDDQDLLRRTFTSHQFLNPLFKHRARLLPILDQIWKERWNGEFSWDNVVKLTHDILLI
jgi:C6 transcription factor Pro1